MVRAAARQSTGCSRITRSKDRFRGSYLRVAPFSLQLPAISFSGYINHRKFSRLRPVRGFPVVPSKFRRNSSSFSGFKKNAYFEIDSFSLDDLSNFRSRVCFYFELSRHGRDLGAGQRCSNKRLLILHCVSVDH